MPGGGREKTRTDTSIREGPEEPLINPVPGAVSYICTRKIAARIFLTMLLRLPPARVGRNPSPKD